MLTRKGKDRYFAWLARSKNQWRGLIRLCGAAALALSAIYAADPVSFDTPKAFFAGESPTSVAAGDFDKDGNQDLAVTSGYRNVVQVLLSNGRGGFRPPVSYPLAGSTREPVSSVVVADFNRDGKLDLAVAGASTNAISILLGNGDGTFGPAVAYAANGPLGLVTGDLNGDGAPDLAAVGFGGVVVLLNNGDGTFQPPVGYRTPSPHSVALGDFNGDGKLDLATADETILQKSAVSILLGNGDGTFQPAVQYAAGSAPLWVAVGDFNGDEKLDVAVATGSSMLVVLAGNGDGTFQPPVSYPLAAASPTGIVAADFNGDGKTDLAVSSQLAGCVAVLLSNAKGALDPAVLYPAPSAQGLAVADFNADGKRDLAVISNSTFPGYWGDVSILLGNGHGAFGHPDVYAVGEFPASVAVGDFNGDGKLDLAVANGDGGLTGPGTVSILLGNGDGTFGPQMQFAAGGGPTIVKVGDFNLDGKLDLAVTNFALGTSVTVLLGNGDGTFQSPIATQVGSEPYGLGVGDFNGDGKPDLAVGDAKGVVILLGNGDGTFQKTATYSAPYFTRAVAVGDFNGDGFEDVAVDAAGIEILLGNGDGTFRYGVYMTDLDLSAVADFNGDGKLDLAGPGIGVAYGQVGVALGNGDGTFQPPTYYQAGFAPGIMAVADFNGDGKLDIAAPNTFTVSILLGNGDGTMRPAVNFEGGCNPVAAAAGQFGTSHKVDLAVVNPTVNGTDAACMNVAVLMNNTRE